MKKNIFGSGLAKNTGALYLVQISNYVIPIIILPFLTRHLGKESYGEYVSLQSLIAYGMVITDYGFQLSATRKIAGMLEAGQSIADVYVQVTAARLVLGVLATLITFIAIIFLPYIDLSLSFALALAVLNFSNALTPLWLFQGLQKMVLVSIIVLSSRMISAALALLLVKSPHDVGLALWAQTIGVALPSFFAMWQANKMVPTSWKFSVSRIVKEMSDGWPIFQTAIFSSLLTNSGVLILGVVSGPQVAGGYAAIERVAKGVASTLSPVTQAIYPKVSISFTRSFDEGVSVIRRFGLPLIFLSTLLAVSVILLSVSGGIGHFLGNEYQAFAGCLIVFAPWIVFGVVNNILGIQYLTNIGQQKWYASAFTISSSFAIIMFFVLGRVFSYWGIAGGLVLAEALLTILLLVRSVDLGKHKSEVKQ